MNPKYLIKLMRPQQWIKNFFVFAALLFAGMMFNFDKVVLSIYAFIAFCLASSAIYIINDIVDIENDKKHPKKKERPLASGKVKVKTALILLFILLIVSLVISYSINLSVFYTILSYIFLNILYSKWLKHVVIIDLFIVASGYVLRVLAGIFAISSIITSWFLAATFTLSLMIILAKRRAELVLHGSKKRKVLEYYDLHFMDLLLVMSSTITLTIYFLWSINNHMGLNETAILLSSLFVFYGLARYLYLTIRLNYSESPTKLILKDKPLILTVLLWCVYMILLIYVI